MKIPLKRALSLLLCFALALGFAACAPQETAVSPTPDAAEGSDAPALYTPGTYTASAAGNNGTVTVAVTFTETAISAVEVTAHSETPGIGDAAIEQIPGAIVGGQTLAVDAVSGATNTSNAILDAVEDCVEQAGGDVAALKAAAAEKPASTETTELSAGVVVVGGGGAGLTAAIAAAQEGAEVILIEKAGVLGGNTIMSGGGLNTADPVRQGSTEMSESMRNQLAGYLEYDPAGFGDFAAELETLKTQIQEYLDSGETYLFDSPELHMIQSYEGSKRTGLDGTVVTPDHDLLATLCNQTLPTCEWLETLGVQFKDTLSTAVGALWQRTHDVEGGASALIATLEESAEAQGVTILTQTRGTEILMEDGRAVGVRAEDASGNEVLLHAKNGVVLATGGFASNAEMVMEYNNYWPDLSATMPCDGAAGCTGDGIVMAQAAGANLVGMGFIQILPICTVDGQAIRGTQNKIYVNQEGVRFVNENDERDKLVTAILGQTGGRMYAIGDATQYELQGEEKLNALIEKGYACVADTIEDLAAQMESLFGVDAEAFLKTVANYNSYVDAQEDPEFGRYNFIGKIEEAPFVAIMEAPALHHTMGGVQIDTETRVLNADGAAIPGLYAAGEVTGGIHAGNRLGGNAVADAMTFGRIAGQSAANGK